MGPGVGVGGRILVEVKLGKLLRKECCVGAPIKSGSSGRRKRSTQSPPSFLPHFSSAIVETTADESPTKLPSTDTEVKKQAAGAGIWELPPI